MFENDPPKLIYNNSFAPLFYAFSYRVRFTRAIKRKEVTIHQRQLYYGVWSVKEKC